MIYFFSVFYYFIQTYVCSIIDLCCVKYRKLFLLIICSGFCLFAGFRDPEFWLDTDGYLQAYEATTDIFDFDPSNSGVMEKYSEQGFHLMSSIIKTFSNSHVFYLLVISILTFYFLYKFLRQYCVYPLIGFCIYLSRFFLSRNMMQIRAALAYLIVLNFTILITERKFWKFLIMVLIASSFHQSALMFLPAYFICKMKLSPQKIILILLAVFLFTILVANLLVLYIVNIPELKAVISTYIDESSHGYSAGITNPMIYYQIFLLLFYTYQEKNIKCTDKNYYTIRSMYLFGTIILIVFNLFAVLAGRLSSMFSSYEILMVPSILYAISSSKKILSSIVVSIFYTAFFFMNVIKLGI